MMEKEDKWYRLKGGRNNDRSALKKNPHSIGMSYTSDECV